MIFTEHDVENGALFSGRDKGPREVFYLWQTGKLPPEEFPEGYRFIEVALSPVNVYFEHKGWRFTDETIKFIAEQFNSGLNDEWNAKILEIQKTRDEWLRTIMSVGE